MKFSHIIASLCVLFFLCSYSALSQTQWFKYAGNPVLPLGSSGSWDAATTLPGRVIFEDTVYRMWYSGGTANSGSNWRIGHASSRDGVTWTKSSGTYVLGQGTTDWESVSVMFADVAQTGSNYKMWYTGISSSGTYAIGLATSPDGLSWSKDAGSNPVLGGTSWYARGPITRTVLGPDNLGHYKMWFEGDAMVHSNFQIGYATSTDGASWTPSTSAVFSPNPLTSWDDDKVMTPSVLFDGQQYEMFYSGERGDGRTQIGYATSPDGMSWQRSSTNPVVGRGPSSWDLQDMFGVAVVARDNLYHMWYGGTSTFGSFLWRIGYAVSPKGMSVSIVPAVQSVDRTKDTVRVIVQIAGPSPALSFSVEIESPDESPCDTLDLYDDGTHGDNLANDGVYANKWIPGEKNEYWMDLQMKLNDTLRFEEMNNFEHLLVTLVHRESHEIPSKYSLSQNYPNPFNPTTEIRFCLPKQSGVSLKIFDLSARNVATLVSGELHAGTYRATWDATGLPSGVYFYRLRAGNLVETKKLILIR